MVVLAVLAQVLGELVDARGEQRDLDLGGPGVGVGACRSARRSRACPRRSGSSARDRSRGDLAHRARRRRASGAPDRCSSRTAARPGAARGRPPAGCVRRGRRRSRAGSSPRAARGPVPKVGRTPTLTAATWLGRRPRRAPRRPRGRGRRAGRRARGWPWACRARGHGRRRRRPRRRAGTGAREARPRRPPRRPPPGRGCGSRRRSRRPPRPGDDPRLELAREQQHVGVAAGALARSGSSRPPRRACAPRRADQHLLHEVLGGLRARTRGRRG